MFSPVPQMWLVDGATMVSEVGPRLADLGVHIHQVKAVRGGRAIIRTPLVAGK